MRRGRAGQSIIALAVLSAVMVVGIGIIVNVAVPVLENMRDVNAIDTSRDILNGLDDLVRSVAEGGKGSAVNTSLRFSRGTFVFDAAEDEIRYEIETGARIVPPHTSRQVGNLRISSMASTTVERAEVDGQDCWRMENEYVSVCIRTVPRDADDAIGAETHGLWRFEGSGQDVEDNSTHGNDGTLGVSNGSEASDPARVEGLRGRGLEFDGSDDLVQIDNPDLGDLEEFTVSAWVKTSASDPGTVAGTAGGGFTLRANSTGVVWTGRAGSSSTVVGPGISDGNWHNVVGTYNGSELELYVDGVERGEAPLSGSLDAVPDLYIGSSDSTSGSFDGVVDEVRVWNRSFTPERARYEYNRSGYLDYVDTRSLLIGYRNLKQGVKLEPEFGLKVNTGLMKDDDNTRNGTGYVQPRITGENLGRGEITVHLESFYGINYNIVFTLYSGSDFLQVDLEES
ncbi:MAG: LamG domain-containing protein [Candidatus Nanohaloarchaea archaeon]